MKCRNNRRWTRKAPRWYYCQLHHLTDIAVSTAKCCSKCIADWYSAIVGVVSAVSEGLVQTHAVGRIAMGSVSGCGPIREFLSVCFTTACGIHMGTFFK